MTRNRKPGSSAWLERARNQWRYRGVERPPFAIEPGANQESVWDYPRPPVIKTDTREVVVRAAGQELARTSSGVRVLETASPPTFYLPPVDVHLTELEGAPGQSFCEWKGAAAYWALRETQQVIGWSYPDPLPGFEALAGWYSFYPGRVECTVGGAPVEPQPGKFYGGWVTPELVGPFKGEPGSEGW